MKGVLGDVTKQKMENELIEKLEFMAISSDFCIPRPIDSN